MESLPDDLLCELLAYVRCATALHNLAETAPRMRRRIKQHAKVMHYNMLESRKPLAGVQDLTTVEIWERIPAHVTTLRPQYFHIVDLELLPPLTALILPKRCAIDEFPLPPSLTKFVAPLMRVKLQLPPSLTYLRVRELNGDVLRNSRLVTLKTTDGQHVAQDLPPTLTHCRADVDNYEELNLKRFVKFINNPKTFGFTRDCMYASSQSLHLLLKQKIIRPIGCVIVLDGQFKFPELDIAWYVTGCTDNLPQNTTRLSTAYRYLPAKLPEACRSLKIRVPTCDDVLTDYVMNQLHELNVTFWRNVDISGWAQSTSLRRLKTKLMSASTMQSFVNALPIRADGNWNGYITMRYRNGGTQCVINPKQFADATRWNEAIVFVWDKYF